MEDRIANGTVVVKVKSGPHDFHQDGDRATVKSSGGPIVVGKHTGEWSYFVEWESTPGQRVYIAGGNIVPYLPGRRGKVDDGTDFGPL